MKGVGVASMGSMGMESMGITDAASMGNVDVASIGNMDDPQTNALFLSVLLFCDSISEPSVRKKKIFWSDSNIYYTKYNSL